MTPFLRYAWYVGTILEAIACANLLMLSLLPRYPVLSIFLLVSCGHSLFLINSEHYFVDGARTQWITLAGYCAMTLEVFVLQARSFPESRRIATVAGSLFAVVALAVCAGMAGIFPARWGDYRAVAGRQEWWLSMFCLVFTALAGSFWRRFTSIRMAPNLERYSTILTCWLACRFVAEWLVVIGKRQADWVMLAQHVAIVGPLVCVVAVMWMRKEGGQI